MNVQDLRAWIDSLTDDIVFRYKGVIGSICPFNRSDISLCYGDYEISVKSVDDAMTTPFVDGYSISEICDDIEVNA